jgi:hypothetical protein
VTSIYVSFNTDLPLDPLEPGISAAERAARAANYITGTAHPDPGWDGKLSISKQHDQGVVVLDAPAASMWPGITPAPLLPVGTLDGNHGALKKETFTLVAYGAIGEKKSTIVGTALHNVGPQDRAGRGCHLPDQRPGLKGRRRLLFGDSGGPAFLGRYVVGDASFVNSLKCNATGGYQRVGTPYARAFLEQFISS